jgi:ferritin heavy chain
MSVLEECPHLSYYNLPEELVLVLNKQINMEMQAFYFYLNAGRYFQRKDVALHNVAKYFLDQANEEKGHSDMFQEYLILRGGDLRLLDIPAPSIDYSYLFLLNTMKQALDYEKTINNHLLDIHGLADTHKDPHLTNFVEEHFLNEQMDSIKEIEDYITNIKRVGEGLGEYLFDKNMFDKK